MVNQKKLARYEGEVKSPNYIKFAKNWNNKLDCPFFTTIRNVEKSNYYELRVGERFDVLLNGKKHCVALLKDVNILDFKDVTTPEIFVIDTGEMNYMDLFKKFKLKDIFCLLLFERVG